MATLSDDLQMINLTSDELIQNEQGTISDHQRRILTRNRIQWIVGASSFALICAALAAAIIGKLLIPSVVSWTELFIWLPAGLLWLWLLRSSFAQWRRVNHDLACGGIAEINGRVQCDLSFGVGLLRVPHYHILIGGRKFPVDKHTFFQFKNQEQYRVFHAPTAPVLLGAVQLIHVPTQQLEAFPDHKPRASHNGAFDPVLSHSPVAQENEDTFVEPLTQQEKTIVHLIAQGLSNKEIADELSLSTNTIKMYTSQIYRKLGVHRRTEAVARARQLHIL